MRWCSVAVALRMLQLASTAAMFIHPTGGCTYGALGSHLHRFITMLPPSETEESHPQTTDFLRQTFKWVIIKILAASWKFCYFFCLTTTENQIWLWWNAYRFPKKLDAFFLRSQFILHFPKWTFWNFTFWTFWNF